MARGVVVLLLLALASPASAQPEILVKTFARSERRARSPEDYARARPFPLPLVDSGSRVLVGPSGRAAARRPAAASSVDQAAAPTIVEDPSRFEAVLFDLGADTLRALRGLPDPALPLSLAPRRYGRGGLDFTSSRLVPSTASRVFPYSPVGKLFFNEVDGPAYCSAAVIAKRLLITAAHCLHDGVFGGGFYSDFEFVPAYRYGVAPYGTWYGEAVFVTQAWVDDGLVPHPEDFGIVQIADRDGVSIAEVTGKLTYDLYQLVDDHLHLLGYPSNLDEGEEMHQITTGDDFVFDDSTVAYGSDMSSGSSGGPWIQNFGDKSAGPISGFLRKRLAVVGVTSYGFTDLSIGAQGASILTEVFEALHERACANRAGNC